MFAKLTRYYFKGEMSQGFSALYAAKSLNLLAGGLLGLFMPIFLYTFFDDNIHAVLAWYLAGQILTMFLYPVGAKILNKLGFRRSLLISAFLGSIYYIWYYFLEPSNAMYIIPLSILTLVAWRLTYWLPYHVKFLEYAGKKSRSSYVSFLMATASMFSVVAPVVSAFIIDRYSYDVLFVIAICLFLISSIPYTYLTRTNEKYTWTYGEVWRNVFKRKYRTLVVSMFAVGAESVIGLYIWPIFIFILLNGNYMEVGILSTMITAITIVIQLMLGKRLDGATSKSGTLKKSSLLYAIGWILKIFVTTAFHVFLAGVYHGIVRIFTRTPLDTIVYEIAADQGHYLDEFTILRELALHCGRITTTLVLMLLLIYIPIQWTFVLAAFSVLGFNLLYAKKIHIT